MDVVKREKFVVKENVKIPTLKSAVKKNVVGIVCAKDTASKNVVVTVIGKTHLIVVKLVLVTHCAVTGIVVHYMAQKAQYVLVRGGRLARILGVVVVCYVMVQMSLEHIVELVGLIKMHGLVLTIWLSQIIVVIVSVKKDTLNGQLVAQEDQVMERKIVVEAMMFVRLAVICVVQKGKNVIKHQAKII